MTTVVCMNSGLDAVAYARNIDTLTMQKAVTIAGFATGQGPALAATLSPDAAQMRLSRRVIDGPLPPLLALGT